MRFHLSPSRGTRVQLYMTKKELFLIPTGCVVGENIDDYWNVDGERELSDAWTGFTRFI